MAKQAIYVVASYLRRAVKDGNDLEARDGMALAATMGGLAFSNAGVALVHAMEYPVGGAVHVSHGAGNGLLLPYVMRHTLPARIPEFARIAEFLGANVTEKTPQQSAERAIVEVENLREAIGIPLRLRELGVTQEQLPDFAHKAAKIERLIKMTPCHTTAHDIL